jgi:hypothetical protein
MIIYFGFAVYLLTLFMNFDAADGRKEKNGKSKVNL